MVCLDLCEIVADGFKSVEGSMYGAVVKLMIDSLFQLRDTVSYLFKHFSPREVVH